jgi:hypothetical protein
MLRIGLQYYVVRITGRIPHKITCSSSRAELDAFAEWIGCMFTPWDTVTPPAVRCWDQFVDWYKSLDLRLPRQAGIHAVVTRILTYKTNRYTKLLLRSQRLKHAKTRARAPLPRQPRRNR